MIKAEICQACLNCLQRLLAANKNHHYYGKCAKKKALEKQRRPRSDCFCSLIRGFPVCYLNKHFVNSSPDNNILFENTKRKVFEILEHLPYCEKKGE